MPPHCWATGYFWGPAAFAPKLLLSVYGYLPITTLDTVRAAADERSLHDSQLLFCRVRVILRAVVSPAP